MQSRRWMLLPMCGLWMTIAIGCHSMHPYPYGSYGYPGGYYSAPPAGAGTSPSLGPGSGSPTDPQTYNPYVPSYGAGEGQWQQSQQSRQPQPQGDGSSQSGSSGGSAGQQNLEGQNLPPDDQYGDPQTLPGDASFNGGPQDSPFESQRSPFEGDSGAHTGADRFDQVASGEPGRPDTGTSSKTLTSRPSSSGRGAGGEGEPISVQAASQTRVVSRDDNSGQRSTVGESSPSPYGYDRHNYRWLRGVVDYEPADDSWNIIYSLRPDPQDEFGGSMRLVGDEQLAGLTNEDVVLVEGHVDPERPDSLGKPQYRVQHLARLVPQR